MWTKDLHKVWHPILNRFKKTKLKLTQTLVMLSAVWLQVSFGVTMLYLVVDGFGFTWWASLFILITVRYNIEW